MKSLSLQTRLIIASLFLGLYSLGASLAYWMRSESDADLAQIFERDLAVLSRLPRLQGRLRELDLLTDQFLLTGNGLLIEERQEALGQVRILQTELARIVRDERGERRIFDQMGEQLRSYLLQQNHWIERKRAGRMTPSDGAKIAARQRPFDKLLELLIGMRDVNLNDLQNRRADSRRLSTYVFLLILLTGLAASAALIYFLLRHIIEPVIQLESQVLGWELGRSWGPYPAHASPEVFALCRRIQEMAERINRQYEKEAELGRLKTQLVSIMSHEFNNALSVIHGVSALLEETEGEAPPEKRQQYYQMLKANIRSLGMEANTILQMGRLESGNFALQFRSTDVAAILQESVERLRIIFERKHHRVEIEAPPVPLLARADPEALSLVVTNLFSNAIKYTPESGSIRLRVASLPANPGTLRVSISDTGIGIPPEDKERVFSGFYRTKESQSAAKGFGVGLQLANKIVQGHGGRLEFDSVLGKGTEFYFTLALWREES